MRGLTEVGTNGIRRVPEIRANKITYCCPYCGVLATLTPILWTEEHCICQCDNTKCGKTFYARVETTSETVNPAGDRTYDFEILETYPKYVPEKHASIPQNIWSDFSEACKSFDVKAYKATVVMCRRMLQSVCLERGAKKKNANGNWIPLRDQIKEAFPQKDYALIHSIADGIKYFGDYGAHPQDDGIDAVKKEDSKELLDFTYNILEIAYINVWKLQQLSAKRSTKT